MLGPLIALFQEERDRFDRLISMLGGCFEGLHEIRYAWIESLPHDVERPLEVSFVGDSESLSWLAEELQRRVLRTEREFDLIVEVRAFTRADAPTHSAEASILLAGVPFESVRSERKTPRTHREREERALRLSRAITEILEQNPSLVRRAIRHVERVLHEDPGAATHDLREWQAILTSYSLERLKEFLVAETSRAERLRQSSPFFAALSSEERDRVLEFLETDG